MAERRVARGPRLVIGFVLLTAYVCSLGLLWSYPATALESRSEANAELSTQILALAGVTFLITCLVAVRHLGVGEGLKLVAREAWPGLLAGFALALFTGFPLRVLVPADRFWSVLGPLYVVGVVAILWIAQSAMPDRAGPNGGGTT